jgi:poly-gamma-glutamate synthesis protein (capsule biosynthesis protein)
MANNHIQNFGGRGFADTKATLTKAGIIGVADYETTTMDLSGIKVSFLALDDITHPLDLDSVYPIMADLGARSQAIIVLIHWGNEYQPLPNERQKTIAKALVNSGATIILGTHPHVLQPIEVEGNSLIVYSLGNFVFDQMWSAATRKSIILELDLTFTEGKLTHLNHESIPITIFDYGQPRIDGESESLIVK